MLRKLLKYDLRPTFRLWRILAPIFFGTWLLYAIFTRATEGITYEAGALYDTVILLDSLFTLLLTVSTGGLVVATLVMVVRRYIVSFCSDEGYLTFSLPIPRKTLYLSKVLSAALWDAALFLLALVLVVLWVIIVGGGSWAFVESLFITYFVEMNPVLSAIGFLLLPLLLVAVDFFHINLIYALAGSAAGYAGKRVNPGRIVLVAVLLYYVLPAIEGGFLIPVVIISIAIADVAAGLAFAFSLLGVLFLAIAVAAVTFLGFWLYYHNVDTLENRLNLS